MIVSTLNTEAEQWLGCGMTYTLFECLKEKLTEILDAQPTEIQLSSDILTSVDKLDLNKQSDKAPKKEQLTKSQKRRQWERSDHRGEKARGWNWVDLVKHLSQTGGKNDSSVQVTTNY